MHWPAYEQRLRETSPTYAQGSAPRRFQLERVLKQLLVSAQGRVEEDPPSEAALTAVRRDAAAGKYPRASLVRSLFAQFQPLPVHPLLVECLLRATPSSRGSLLHGLRRVRRRFQLGEDCDALGDIPLDAALAFCLGKNHSSEARVQYLIAHGFQEEKNLRAEVERMQEARRCGQALFRRLQLPNARVRDCYVPLHLALGPLEQVTHDVHTIQQGLRKVPSSRRKFCVDLLSRFLPETVTNEIHVPRTAIQRWARLSPWHADVVRQLQEALQRKQHVAFLHTHTRLVLAQFATFVAPLERYARETAGTTLTSFLQTASEAELRLGVLASLQQHKARNDRVKNARGGHHVVSAAVRALRFLRCPLGVTSSLTLRSLLADIPNLRQARDLNVRRTFTDAECDAMFRCVRDPCEALCFTLLREVGLRNGALQHLTYASVVDKDGLARAVCATREKGNRVRVFCCSANLRQMIQNCADFWRRTHADLFEHDAFLLHKADVRVPLPTVAVGVLLKRLALAAGVTDVHVHPHAFRHTLVGKLVAAGNPMEVVAKFIGHADARTTSSFYWTPGAEELADQIINPFTGGMPAKESPDMTVQLAQAKLDATKTVLDALLLVAGQPNAMEALQRRVPNYAQILAVVNSPSAGLSTLVQEETVPRRPSVLQDFEPSCKKRRVPFF